MKVKSDLSFGTSKVCNNFSIKSKNLSFDSVLLGTILYFTRETLDDYERFSTQIVIILLLSILIPAVITAVTIGSQRPLVLIGPDQWINLKTVID